MNKSILSPMGRRIFVGMAATGIATEVEFARRVGVSTLVAKRWLYGRRCNIDAKTLMRISDALQLSGRWLLTGKGSPTLRRPVSPTEAKILFEYERLTPGRQTIIQHCLAQLNDLG